MQILTGMCSCLQIHMYMFIPNAWKAIIDFPTEGTALLTVTFFHFFKDNAILVQRQADSETRFTNLHTNTERKYVVEQTHHEIHCYPDIYFPLIPCYIKSCFGPTCKRGYLVPPPARRS